MDGWERNKSRRLSVAEVEALEMSFEAEKKLQPHRKLQLAQLLGLQPRQIAVWFQNRRARWKAKQLQKDFLVLNQNFRVLKSNYDGLVEEIGKLQSEFICINFRVQARRLRCLESGNSMEGLPEPSSPLGAFLKARSEAAVDISEDSLPNLAEDHGRACLDRQKSCGSLEEQGYLWSQALCQEISD